MGQSLVVKNGTDVTIAAVGNKLEVALEVEKKLKNLNISADVIYSRFIKPLDSNTILDSVLKTGTLITIEDNAIEGGYGSRILEMISQKGIDARSKVIGYPDSFIPHGSKTELQHIYRLDADSIYNDVLKLLNKKRG